jgi:hypothetical protein
VAVVAVVLGLNEMLFALAPQGGRPTEATCAFAGALVDVLGVNVLGVNVLGVNVLGVNVLGVNVLGVNVLGFGVWTLIYTAPRWDALVLGPARGAPYPFTPNMALLS